MDLRPDKALQKATRSMLWSLIEGILGAILVVGGMITIGAFVVVYTGTFCILLLATLLYLCFCPTRD